MIEYVVPDNIDDRILTRSARLLSGGKLIALPSDTNWVAACSLHAKEGVKKLRRLSGERDERHFTLLCSDISQFGDFCSLDNSRFRLIKRLAPGPYVFILKTLLGTEKTLGLRRRELGVRIPNHPVPQGVSRALGAPLYSISAKRSMAQADRLKENPPDQEGESNAAGMEEKTTLPPIPEDELFEGGWELEAVDPLDLILDPGEEQKRIFSTILDMTGDEVLVLRQGAGAWPV